MPRRRNNPIEEFVAVVGGLFVLGTVVSPQLRAVVLLLAIVAFLLFLGWIAYRIGMKGRREMQAVNSGCSVSSSDSVAEPSISEKVRALDWFQFEKLIAAIYETKGYSVKRLGGAKPDGGIDLIVENTSDRFVVQCKQWKAWKVGVRQIREFLGTLTDSRIPRGVFITLQGYTDDARALANKHNISLLSEESVIKLLEDVHWKFNPAITSALNDQRKLCPRCESELVLRTATRGNGVGSEFWGCSNFPRCKFTMDAR
jgi:HJR/Mrr/RecB family endonuclease